MKNYEEQALAGIELDDDAVMQYLLQNPDFFIRNARLVEQMHIPHPVRGSVSLVEWQLGRQRNQIGQLEEEITLLMEQAGLNEVLFSRCYNCKPIWRRRIACKICSIVCNVGPEISGWLVLTFGYSVTVGRLAHPLILPIWRYPATRSNHCVFSG